MLQALVFEFGNPNRLNWLPVDEASRRALGVHWVETLDSGPDYREAVVVVEPGCIDGVIARMGIRPLPVQSARARINQCREILRRKQGREGPFLPLDFDLWTV